MLGPFTLFGSIGAMNNTNHRQFRNQRLKKKSVFCLFFFGRLICFTFRNIPYIFLFYLTFYLFFTLIYFQFFFTNYRLAV